MTAMPLRIAREGAVAVLTLDRPEKLNALNRALVAALTGAVRDLSRDADLRAIVLTGAGRAFCCGLDLVELAAAPDAAASLDWHGDDSLLTVLRACPHPVIAAVNGYAVTGGLELALMADFILAADTAKFADTHARVGITPSWGMTQVLPRLIGPNRARQMSLTGTFIDAAQALAWGLVNEVLPPGALMPRARALADEIAQTDLSTMTRIRNLIGTSNETHLNEGLICESQVFDSHIGTVSSGAIASRREKVTTRGRAINRTETSR